MRLEGKVALISGGARGQGAVEARLFAREGAKVVLGDILEREGVQVAAEIAESGSNALFVQLDVTSEGDWQNAIDTTVSRFGKLDILANNAGVWRGNLIETTTSEEWDMIMGVNAKGVFLGTKMAIPEMRKSGGRSVINISSVAGLVGSPRSSAYNASKGAVRLFTKATAVQYGKDGIRANSIHPGPIDTTMGDQVWPDEGSKSDSIARTLLGRIGTSEDVAYGALYLASEESSFVTRTELVIDGGITAQ